MEDSGGLRGVSMDPARRSYQHGCRPFERSYQHGCRPFERTYALESNRSSAHTLLVGTSAWPRAHRAPNNPLLRYVDFLHVRPPRPAHWPPLPPPTQRCHRARSIPARPSTSATCWECALLPRVPTVVYIGRVGVNACALRARPSGSGPHTRSNASQRRRRTDADTQAARALGSI